MARAEENFRRFTLPNPGPLNAVYMDQLMDVSDLTSANALCDFSLISPTYHEDLTSSIVALPPVRSPKKLIGIERHYRCSECEASFSNASNLKSHTRIHTGEKNFKCDQCDKAFTQSSNLKSHKRTHTGEKPFECNLCGKRFSRSSHLSGHKRIHTGETPYSCIICAKSFTSNTQLRKHVDKHSESDSHTCSICEKSFSKKSALTIHLSIHNRERPHVCVLCSAAFRSREDLHVHKKLHPGDEYPFSCKVCGKGFKIKLCCEKHADKCKLQTPHPPQSLSASLKKFGTSKKSELDLLIDSLGTSTFELNEFEPPFQNGQSQMFQIDDSQGLNGLCKMELLEGSIEDGIEFEVEEQMLVLTNEGENSYIRVIPVNDESISLG